MSFVTFVAQRDINLPKQYFTCQTMLQKERVTNLFDSKRKHKIANTAPKGTIVKTTTI